LELQRFYELIRGVEVELKLPVWLVCQGEATPPPWDQIDNELSVAIRRDRTLAQHDQVAMLIHSPGGDARCAYHLGTTFARRPGGFVAVVPYIAKSAATLIVLGATKIILGRLGELGPLDAQMIDMDKEQIGSALDEVQSLERLHKFALDAFDQTLTTLKTRTRKKYDKLLPVAGEFVTGLVRPLFESVDVIHYTSLSRTLKVAEDYAVRLMEPRVGRATAKSVVNKLISDYPEHGFVIDVYEAERIGLPAEQADGTLADLLDEIVPLLEQVTAVGRVVPTSSTTGGTP
jgi:Serine dehydrogenase proteinase